MFLKKSSFDAEQEYIPFEQKAHEVDDITSNETIILCVTLYLTSRVPYNSIPRILNAFHTHTPLSLNWHPDPTSVNNWVRRIGLALLQQVKPIDEPWMAIIDHSIGTGTQKVLVVLRVRFDTLCKKGKAIALEDCECVGLKVVETVNGETVAEDLAEVFEQSGQPLCIVKDRDATLNRGARIWSNSLDEEVHLIDDIGHVVASFLKAEFEQDEDYKALLKKTNEMATAVRQTELACASPPKMQTKARFQGLLPLAKWVQKILNKLKVRGRPAIESFLGKLRRRCAGIKALGPFLERFIQSVNTTANMMEWLKNEGLTLTSYHKSIMILAELPDDSKVKIGLQEWLDKHIAIYRQLGICPLMISSDIIESLFGIFKYIHGRSPQKDINSGILLIPTLCGQLGETEMTDALNQVSHTMLASWLKDNIPQTILQQRRIHFN